jgi:NarL family two-component system response regulator LiaR
MQAIRVLLVEDEIIVRDAICALLALEETIAVVGEAATAAEGVQLAQSLQPDIVLVDLGLPDKRGTEIIGDLLKNAPKSRVILLSASFDEQELALAFAAGVSGYVRKTQSVDELIQMIHGVHNGRKFPPQLTSAQTKRHRRGGLSHMETRVLALLAQGLTSEHIGQKLGIKSKTVESHVGEIISKLQVRNRTQAALYALKHRLIE